MPSVLSAQQDQRLAREHAEELVSHAEADRERRGERQFTFVPSSGSVQFHWRQRALPP